MPKRQIYLLNAAGIFVGIFLPDTLAQCHKKTPQGSDAMRGSKDNQQEVNADMPLILIGHAKSANPEHLRKLPACISCRPQPERNTINFAVLRYFRKNVHF